MFENNCFSLNHKSIISVCLFCLMPVITILIFFFFRLVQDENAKTILLNVPLEDQSTPSTPSKPTHHHSTSTFTNTKPPRRPVASPKPGQSSSSTTTTTTSSGDVSRRKMSTKSLPPTSSARVRSASVGRDKHSDTQVSKSCSLPSVLFVLK